MSDLLNSASLVLIPSGYKEDIVYSAVPTDGSGDLSFTRASNGTRVNSAGLVEVVAWNLYTYSEVFSNSIWATGNATITDNTITAPNGTLTADSIFEQAVNDYQLRGQNYSMVSGQTFTFSIYVKANTRNFFRILVGNGVLGSDKYAYFDLINLTTTSTTLITPSIESVGNGWCKVVISFTATITGTDAIYFGSSPNMTSGYLPFVGDASKGVYIWGAQLNIGSTAKPYFPTTDRLNVPRLTYQNGGGGCPSLLLEKQSTNLVSYSEQFDNAYWIKQQVTLSANATTSPDGTQNADSVIPTTTNSALHRVYENNSNSIATASYSIFVKPNGYYRVAFRESATTGAAIGFDLLNKTIITTYSTGGCTASGGKIEEVGNGWYRISGIFAFASATAQSLGLYIVSPSWTSGDPEGVAWAGNGIDGLYFWGAQVEQSSYPTSYIPTTSASATRVADACSKTSATALIGQTEGVMFVDFVVNGFEDYGTPLSLNDGSTTNYIWFTTFANGNIRAEAFTAGAVQAQIVMSGGVVGQRYKMAFAYKANDFALYINGTQIGVDLFGSVPPNLSRLDSDLVGAWAQQSQKINQIALFKTRLSNSDLIALTTI